MAESKNCHHKRSNDNRASIKTCNKFHTHTYDIFTVSAHSNHTEQSAKRDQTVSFVPDTASDHGAWLIRAGSQDHT